MQGGGAAGCSNASSYMSVEFSYSEFIGKGTLWFCSARFSPLAVWSEIRNIALMLKKHKMKKRYATVRIWSLRWQSRLPLEEGL